MSQGSDLVDGEVPDAPAAEDSPPRPDADRLTLATAIAAAAGLVEVSAVELFGAVEEGEAPALVEVEPVRRRPATVLSTAPAKELEARLREVDGEVDVVARGGICLVQIHDDGRMPSRLAVIADAVGDHGPLVIASPPAFYRGILEELGDRVGRVLLVAESELDSGDSALLEMAKTEAAETGARVEVVTRRPGRIAARRALAGSSPGRRGTGGDWGARVASRLAGERGQATPLILGAVFALVVAAVVLVAIAGAISGKGKAQRAADLSALSAARSMKDDLPRLLAPPTLPNGLPNPAHMPKPLYLSRARLTAVRIATANGASPLTVSVRFPDRLSYAPVRSRVSIKTRVEGAGPTDPVSAEARIGASVATGAVPAVASGGGYSGPLEERQGYGMRPDVAVAFDRLGQAAAAAGVTIAINSAFRSDAEQARLFAANPDPRWVARPGTSLHRCATELDLGPPSSYGWLAANAGRFGFVKRYSWEPWHFGFTDGPAPCSEAGNRVRGGADRSQSLPESVPSFVPSRYRRTILRAAMKWGVSAALLSAQLLAESNFDPGVVSSAGAQGIAQFMPGTAAAYGLRDPFDPRAAIDAQAHMMSDLLKQFRSPALALAAYNAGPGAVSPCDCIPDYPETQAYVAKILALLDGAGAMMSPLTEIELVE